MAHSEGTRAPRGRAGLGAEFERGPSVSAVPYRHQLAPPTPAPARSPDTKVGRRGGSEALIAVVVLPVVFVYVSWAAVSIVVVIVVVGGGGGGV